MAVTGESAIGARIFVWWPMDEDWYPGFVTAFDPFRQRHTICYDDGDVEIVCLWAPNQLVVLLFAKNTLWSTDESCENERKKDRAAAEMRHACKALRLQV